MGYVNPVLAMGEERFLDACAAEGVDAVILPDLPPEEAAGFRRLAAARGVRTVFLLAPTSTEGRVAEACAAATGFVYFVSVTGVTGARRSLPEDLGHRVAAVRSRSPVPVVVGFGVSTPAQARQVARIADGVVVGSAIVSRLAAPGSRRARVERALEEQRRSGVTFSCSSVPSSRSRTTASAVNTRHIMSMMVPITAGTL